MDILSKTKSAALPFVVAATIVLFSHQSLSHMDIFVEKQIETEDGEVETVLEKVSIEHKHAQDNKQNEEHDSESVQAEEAPQEDEDETE